MASRTRRIFKWALLPLGLFLGLAHLRLAAKAGFVARGTEPFSFWVALLTGPASTLPGSLTAFFKPVAGGLWLSCGAFISYLAMMSALGPEADFAKSVSYFGRISGPMLALGLAAIFLARRTDSAQG